MAPGQSGDKRPVKAVVLSDIHLGTVGCHAAELLAYLRSIEPEILVLNGDIVDIWQFSRYYWPKSHTKVLQRLMKMAGAGAEIYYVTGNHDELLRKFAEQHLGNFHLVNKVVLELDGRRTWIFHGDVFDVITVNSKWLAKLGSIGYDALILINRIVNLALEKLGRGRISLSKRIKDSVKSAAKFIGDFEKTAIELAFENGFDAVACGHIHKPAVMKVETEQGSVLYLNSGDWVENLTALEYDNGEWSIFKYRDHEGDLVKESDSGGEAEPALEGALGLAGAAAVLDFAALKPARSKRLGGTGKSSRSTR